MKRLVVYGTLRTGGAFSGAMPRNGKVEVHELRGVRVYSTPSFFPGAQITGDKEDYVLAEVWDYEGHLSDDEWNLLIRRLDGIEGCYRNAPEKSLFTCETIDTPMGEAYIYVLAHKGLLEETLEKNVVVHDWAEVAKNIRLPGGNDGEVKGRTARGKRKAAGESE